MSNKHKEMSYPYYRRNDLTFYKVVDSETITAIAIDESEDFYSFVGMISGLQGVPDEAEVLGFDQISEQDWDEVLDNVKSCARVGGRPNIPPPPPH